MIIKKMCKSQVHSVSTLKRVATEVKLLHTVSTVPHTFLPIVEIFQTETHFYYTMERYGSDIFDFMKLGDYSRNGVGFDNEVTPVGTIVLFASPLKNQILDRHCPHSAACRSFTHLHVPACVPTAA